MDSQENVWFPTLPSLQWTQLNEIQFLSRWFIENANASVSCYFSWKSSQNLHFTSAIVIHVTWQSTVSVLNRIPRRMIFHGGFGHRLIFVKIYNVIDNSYITNFDRVKSRWSYFNPVIYLNNCCDLLFHFSICLCGQVRTCNVLV